MAKVLSKFGVGLGAAAVTVAGTLAWCVEFARADSSADASPATRPAQRTEADNHPDSHNSREDRRRGRPERDRDEDRGRDRWHHPSEEEWTAARAFMADHSPTRLALYEQFDGFVRRKMENDEELPGPLKRVRAYLYGRYRSLGELQERDPEFFAFAIKQFEAEDRILGAMIDVRQARHREDEKAVAEAQEQVEAGLTDYVERTLAERQARIERLEGQLDEERHRLKRDRAQIEELKQHMRERLERILPRYRPNRDRDRNGPSTRPADA